MSSNSDIPELIALDGQIENIGSRPFAQGGYADIYHGSWCNPNDVVIKLFHGSQSDKMTDAQKQAFKRQLDREFRVWAALAHDNVLPLLGLYGDDEFAPAGGLVSPYRPCGDIPDFISGNPRVDRMALIKGIASGLKYLHSKDIVHGDLKARNIMVHEVESIYIPQIADFGRSRVLMREGDTTGLHSSIRHLAPELLFKDDTKSLTKAGDVYSFGMVMLEILTEERPFVQIPNDNQIVLVVNSRERPERKYYSQTFLSDYIWSLLEACWNATPSERPTMEKILTKWL